MKQKVKPQSHETNSVRRRCERIAGALLALVLAASIPARAVTPSGTTLKALDIIELDICYTTMMARYYKPVSPAQLLEGSRRSATAYLKSRGIANPDLPPVPANIDKWKAEDALTHDVGYAILKYGSKIVPTALVQASCSGQLASVHDPYTVLFHPAEFKDFNAYLGPESFGGIGVIFVRQDAAAGANAGPVVQEVIPDGPADKAGIVPGDVITAVDGAPAASLAPRDLQTRLRGKVGTAVTLAVAAKDAAQTKEVRLIRAAITRPEVTYRMVAPGVGYLSLRTFGVDSSKQVAHAIERLRAQGAASFIFDLRNNGGGYREQSVDVASQFVGGTILSQQERTGAPTVYRAKNVPRLGAPLVVLVNGDTASGSEIVAAAVQDNRAGTVVGTKTFGKGLVQEVYPLPDGAAMKLTTARYLTAAGRDINEAGVVPDVMVPMDTQAKFGVAGFDPQLDKAIELLKTAPSPGPSASG